jgi:hypothetical protein
MDGWMDGCKQREFNPFRMAFKLNVVVYSNLSKWLKSTVVICGSIVTQKLAQCVAQIYVCVKEVCLVMAKAYPKILYKSFLFAAISVMCDCDMCSFG